MPSARRSSLRSAAIFALPVVATGAHAWHYLPFIADDALISLRYVQRLIEGYGLTWTDGVRVEGYSNLLWTLACAGLGAMGVDLIVASRILGAAGSLAVFCALWFRYGRGPTPRHAAFLVGGMTLACSGSFAVWTVGGLEQPLFAALLAWVLTLCFGMLDDAAPRVHTGVTIGILLGCLAITRPDGGIFTVAVAIAMYVGLRTSAMRGPVLRAIVLSAALFVSAQLAFRLWYYGVWVPNTALVKLAFSFHYAWVGMKQVIGGLLYLAPVLALVAISFRVRTRESLRALPIATKAKAMLIVLCIGMWLGYSALSGGDIFPALRAFVPVVVLLAFAAAEHLRTIRNQRRAMILAFGLVALFLAGQLVEPQNNKAARERWEWRGRLVGLLLKDRFGAARPLLAVRAAGAVPYWSQLPCLDLYGLNDYYIPRHRPASFGSGVPSHELGDADYFFATRPDLVLLGIADGRLEEGVMHDKLVDDPRFYQQYTNIVFTTADDSLLTSLWVRNTSTTLDVSALRREADSRGHIKVAIQSRDLEQAP